MFFVRPLHNRLASPPTFLVGFKKFTSKKEVSQRFIANPLYTPIDRKFKWDSSEDLFLKLIFKMSNKKSKTYYFSMVVVYCNVVVRSIWM